MVAAPTGSRSAHPGRGPQAPAGSVLGVDLSARMLARARELTDGEALTNVRFEQVDAQVHAFTEDSVDTVVSSFGTLFFSDPAAAFTNF